MPFAALNKQPSLTKRRPPPEHSTHRTAASKINRRRDIPGPSPSRSYHCVVMAEVSDGGGERCVKPLVARLQSVIPSQNVGHQPRILKLLGETCQEVMMTRSLSGNLRGRVNAAIEEWNCSDLGESFWD